MQLSTIHHNEKPDAESQDRLEEALISGIGKFMADSGFTAAHLGLSGGLDSALVAYLAVKACGSENVVCFAMPSRFSSQGSLDDAKALAANLGCCFHVLGIEGVFSAFLSTLQPVFENTPSGTAEENIQARIRGTLLMAYSNKFGSMLLATGNKSEIAMGYCTLYGDTAGALAPIGGLFKTEVYALCRQINKRAMAAGGKVVIPQAIIDKPPSAELRPNQKDSDSLPPYHVLDEILRLHLCEGLSCQGIIEKGWDSELVKGIVKTVQSAQFKRRQMPQALEIPRTLN